jgi:hypothetical protein
VIAIEVAEAREQPVSVPGLFRLRSAFHGIAYPTVYEDRKKSHASLLNRRERLIERLPRIGELLQICCALSQRIGAPMQEINRIAVTRRFQATITQFAHTSSRAQA